MLTEKQIESSAIEMVKYNLANGGLIKAALKKSLITDEQYNELCFKLECNTMEVFGKLCAIMHSGGNEHSQYPIGVKPIKVDRNNINQIIAELRRMVGDDDNDGGNKNG